MPFFKIFFFLFFFALWTGGFARADAPFFDYSEKDLEFLNKLDSKFNVSKARLQQWDKIINAYFEERQPAFGEKIRVISYLYSAQRDFAFLSLQMKGEMMGSIDPICLSIIRMFYPFFTVNKDLEFDQYSILLAQAVQKKYREWFDVEKKKEEDFQNFYAQNWAEYTLTYGKNVLNWVPWRLPLILMKIANPPTDSEVEWQNQLQIVKDGMENLTPEQMKIINYWGNFYAANWIDLTNDYLFSRPLSLKEFIYIRAFMAMILYDALIFSFEIKYTYMVKPPYIQDPNIKPNLKVVYPYPSYPSSQAMLAETAALTLAYFFPQERETWERYSRNTAQALLWAGINYPLDIQEARRIAKTLFKAYIASEQIQNH